MSKEKKTTPINDVKPVDIPTIIETMGAEWGVQEVQKLIDSASKAGYSLGYQEGKAYSYRNSDRANVLKTWLAASYTLTLGVLVVIFLIWGIASWGNSLVQGGDEELKACQDGNYTLCLQGWINDMPPQTTTGMIVNNPALEGDRQVLYRKSYERTTGKSLIPELTNAIEQQNGKKN